MALTDLGIRLANRYIWSTVTIRLCGLNFATYAIQCLLRWVQYPHISICRYNTYESNIEFVVRFMVDSGLVGCGWVSLQPGRYEVRKDKLSRCQIEIDVEHRNVTFHPPEGEWQAIAPLRILSFDIECATRKGIFPEAEKDRVIQIANVMQIQGEPEFLFKVILTLKETAPVPGAEVSCEFSQLHTLFILCCIPDALL